MDWKARSCLLQNREALEKDIKTSYIMDHMIADEVLTLQEEDKVKTQVKYAYFFAFGYVSIFKTLTAQSY